MVEIGHGGKLEGDSVALIREYRINPLLAHMGPGGPCHVNKGGSKLHTDRGSRSNAD